MVLTRTLREKLVALNLSLSNVVYDDAVRQIAAIDASQTLVATSREKYAPMRDGVQVVFRDDKGKREKCGFWLSSISVYAALDLDRLANGLDR